MLGEDPIVVRIVPSSADRSSDSSRAEHIVNAAIGAVPVGLRRFHGTQKVEISERTLFNEMS